MSSSSLNTGAMLKAAGIGAVVMLVIILINQVVGYLTLMSYYANPSSDMSLLVGVSGLGICFSCAAYLFFGAVGAVYAWFAKQDEGALDVGMSALGGALAAAITAIFYGVVGMITNMLAALVIYPMLSGIESVPGTLGAGSVGVMTSLVSGLGWTCLALFVGAGLGAIGGAIFAAIAGKDGSNNASPSYGA